MDVHQSFHDAKKAILGEHDETEVHGAVVQKPAAATGLPAGLASKLKSSSVLTGDSDDPLVNDAFVLSGTLALFGVEALTTDFYSYHGPLPKHAMGSDEEVPVYQMALLRHGLKLSTILPDFCGTEFDVLNFQNLMVTYQNCSIDHTKPRGWHIYVDLAFDESTGAVHDLLSQFLGVKDPKLRFHCALGLQGDWHKPPSISSFGLEGFFDNVSISICDGVTMTRAGVRLIGFDVMEPGGHGQKKAVKQYGYGVFGTLHLSLPGTATAKDLIFDIFEVGGMFRIEAQMELDWKHAFGIKNLTLCGVKVSAEFKLDNAFQSLHFEMAAVLVAGGIQIGLDGSFSMNGDFSLSATLDNLNLDDICEIYKELFDSELSTPNVDISFGNVTLNVGKGGIYLDVHHLQVGEYPACDGTLSIDSSGVLIKASMAEGLLTFDEVTISDAFVEVSVTRGDHHKGSSVMLGGKFAFLGFELDVGVHLYTVEGESGLQYTIYGDFSNVNHKKTLTLADLSPSLKGSFLEEITIEKVMLIIASRDDPELGAMSHSGYEICKGVQICAILGEVDSLKSLARGQSHQLVVCAAFSSITELDCKLGITVPTAFSLNLGNGVITDPLILEVVLSATPSLRLRTGALVYMQGQKEPLHFTMELDIGATQGTFVGQLSVKGGWNNPFGFSEQITIGPDLAIRVSVIYADFMATGTPTALGLVGGLKVGKAHGQVACQISKLPSEQLLSVDVGDIDLEDIAALTSQVLDVDLGRPSNIAYFEKVMIYVCPCGVRISQTLSYPQGFSFACRMTIFGKKAEVSAVISKTSGALLKGEVDNFTIGPLQVRGFKKTRPSFELELSSKRQGGFVDGRITLFDLDVAINCTLELTPHFIFSFEFTIHFGELFEFLVKAEPKHKDAIGDHSSFGLDVAYVLTAEFHEHGRGQIAKQLDKMFLELARKEKEDDEKAEAELEATKKAFEEKMDQAQRELDATLAAWEAKTTATHAEHERVVADYDRRVQELQGDLDSKNKGLSDEIDAAHAKLNQANTERAQKMHDAEESLNCTRRDWDNDINNKHRELDEATQRLHSEFGSVEHDIQEARDKVNSLQNEINDLDGSIQRCEDSPWYEVGDKAALPGLYTARGSVWFAKEVADGILQGAIGVLEAADFVSCKGAMEAAQLAVEGARFAARGAIEFAEGAVHAADAMSAELVNAAQLAVDGAGVLGREAVHLAQIALDGYREASVAMLKLAEEALSALDGCTEFLAYQTAKIALQVAKAAGGTTIEIGHDAHELASDVKQVALAAGRWISSKIFGIVDITDMSLRLELGADVGGLAFDVVVKGVVGDVFFSIDVHFDPRHTEELIKDIFDKLVDLLKDEVAKPIADLIS